MREIGSVAGAEVVDAEDIVVFSEESVDEMRAEEAGSAGDENLFSGRGQRAKHLLLQLRARGLRPGGQC